MNSSTNLEAYLNEQGKFTYSNVGTSMLPLLRQGRDLLTVEKTEGGFRKGDVVLYRRESGQFVLHRIVKSLPDGFVLLGDSCTVPEYGIKEEQILGVMTSFVHNGKTYSVDGLLYRLYTFFVTHCLPAVITLRKLIKKCRRAVLRNRKAKDSSPSGSVPADRTDEDFIYLLSCAVNGTVPDKSRVSGMDLEKIYNKAVTQSLAAAVGCALSKAGVSDEKFSLAKAKSVRRNVLYASEREIILSKLSKEGIWYMPLKGAVIANYYPEFGMREMGDNDILFDESRAQDVREIILGLGYTQEESGSPAHDIYLKPPCLTFEMHRSLFEQERAPGLYSYYSNVKERLVKDEGREYSYRFTDEDLYIYIIAHISKHYDYAGTGVRSLLDVYILMRKFGDILNWDYINSQLAEAGIADFEKEIRASALGCFSGNSYTTGIERYLESATYGTTEQKIHRQISQRGPGFKGRAGYVFRRIFVPAEVIEKKFPYFYNHKYLIPLLPFYRLGKAVKSGGGHIIYEIKSVLSSK